MGIIYLMELYQRKIEYQGYRRKSNEIAESEEDKTSLVAVLEKLAGIENKFSRALDSLSFKTKFHAAFMTEYEYANLYLIGQEFKQLRFNESDYLKRIFTDGKKLKQIESWMEKNEPDYVPFSKFF